EILERVKKCQAVPSFREWLPASAPPEYVWNWPYQVLIQDTLAELLDGKFDKVMIFLPPRHGKSEMVTVRWPAWLLEKYPYLRIIVGCYGQELANRFSLKTRRIVEGRLPMAPDKAKVQEWETAVGGGLRAVGAGAGIAGYGGNLILIDDPVKNRATANSKTYREMVWNWYQDDLYTRREPDCMMALIMTRWHQDDLAGRILASEDGPNWNVISLPALAEAGDPLGRLPGEALCPARYSEKDLLELQRAGAARFNSLYQQRPSLQEGNIFQREWWQYYREEPPFLGVIQSWDTAFKKNQENDFTVCTTWGITRTGYYILGMWKEKVEFPELKRKVVQLAQRWSPLAVLIEDKASGQSLIQELQRDTGLPIIAVQKNTDTTELAHIVTPSIEAGKVYLPEKAAWVDDLIEETAAFPSAPHDDIVVSIIQALQYLRGRFATGEMKSSGTERVSAAGVMDRYTGNESHGRRAFANY
ncbi:MAG: phage terminase large subunit, partial [Deltaproteobacteria bacterium]